ncbi:MAG: hypothetical protein ACR2NB_01875, partial [Solirubrobacteraceae bacterium]
PLLASIVLAGVAGGGASASRPADALRAQPRDAPARQDPCGPTTAVRNLGTAQALAFVFEYDRPSDGKGFPPRLRQRGRA